MYINKIYYYQCGGGYTKNIVLPIIIILFYWTQKRFLYHYINIQMYPKYYRLLFSWLWKKGLPTCEQVQKKRSLENFTPPVRIHPWCSQMCVNPYWQIPLNILSPLQYTCGWHCAAREVGTPTPTSDIYCFPALCLQIEVGGEGDLPLLPQTGT